MAGDAVALSLEARLFVLSARPQGLAPEQRTEETMSSQTVPDLMIGKSGREPLVGCGGKASTFLPILN